MIVFATYLDVKTLILIELSIAVSVFYPVYL